MKLRLNERNEARAGGDALVLTHYGSDGNMMDQIALTPDEAIILADWIKATFGDESA